MSHLVAPCSARCRCVDVVFVCTDALEIRCCILRGCLIIPTRASNNLTVSEEGPVTADAVL
jgi:hypothetical protein